MWIGHLHTLFCKRSAQIFCPFLIKCLVSLLDRTSLFYIKFLCKNVCIANIFSFTYLVFSLFNSFLQITKVLHFNKVYFIFFFFFLELMLVDLYVENLCLRQGSKKISYIFFFIYYIYISSYSSCLYLVWDKY